MPLTGQWEKRVGIAQEGTLGVLGTVRAWIPVESETLGLPEEPVVGVPQLWGRRELASSYRQARMPAPELQWLARPEDGLGEALKLLFGTSEATQQGTFVAYQHAYTVRQTALLPSASLRALEYGTFVYDYLGCRLNQLVLEMNQNEAVRIRAAFLGQDRVAGAAMAGTYGTTAPWTTHNDLDVLIDGTARSNIKRMALTFTNNLTQHPMLGTRTGPSEITAGMFDLTGEMLVHVEDEYDLSKFLTGTSFRLDVMLTGGSIASGLGTLSRLRLRIPAAEMTAFPIRDESGVIGAAVAFRARYGTNALGTGAVIGELRNSVASYD